MPFAHSRLVLYICNNFSGKTQFCQFPLSPISFKSCTRYELSPKKVAEIVDIKKENLYQHNEKQVNLPMPFAHGLLGQYLFNNFS